jgi:hypothetical protein
MNRHTWLCLVPVGVLWLLLLTLASGTVGCQSGTTGLLRPLSASAYTTATNAIATITLTAAQVAPAPFGNGIELAGGAVLGLLAAWQALSHSRINANTKAINGSSTQKTS